jgi:hypothetical protein
MAHRGSRVAEERRRPMGAARGGCVVKWFVLALAILHVMDVCTRLFSIWEDEFTPPTPTSQAINAVINACFAIALFYLWGQM